MSDKKFSLFGFMETWYRGKQNVPTAKEHFYEKVCRINIFQANLQKIGQNIQTIACSYTCGCNFHQRPKYLEETTQCGLWWHSVTPGGSRR